MGFLQSKIVDRFASTLWGKSTRFREYLARRLVLPVVFATILILVDAAIFFGNWIEDGDPATNLPILLVLHITYAIGLLIWVLQSNSDLDHLRDHLVLQEGFRTDLLDVPDLYTVVAKLFKYIRFCLPVVGAAFYYQRSPGDQYEQITEEWFNRTQSSAATGEFARLSCEHCVPKQPPFSKKLTNPFRWINHRSFVDTSQISCHGIFAGERKLAIICLYFSSGYNPSGVQSDYLSNLISASGLAIQWVKLPESSLPADIFGESERIQMAHYLHDTLVNDLSFLNFKIEQIQNLIGANSISGLQPELSVARIIARRSYKLVRDVLYRLRESQPADLVFALKQFIDVVTSRANIEIDFILEGQTQTLLSEVNRNILYIVREALRNAEKHAKASHVDVIMKWEPGSLRINIIDNGIGFSPDSVQGEKKHFGLNIVRECAEEINANLEINSVLDGGTQLTLTLPL